MGLYNMSFTARAKIQKPLGAEPDELERTVSEALLELEENSDLKAQLREIWISGAKELEYGGGKKVLVISVPTPLLKQVRAFQVRLVRELEKKFSGCHVVIIGQRRIISKPTRKTRNQKQMRPRSRTLTSVHEQTLDDLCFPAEIVGKRTRVKLDGSRVLKVQLDKANWTNVEHKTACFNSNDGAQIKSVSEGISLEDILQGKSASLYCSL